VLESRAGCRHAQRKVYEGRRTVLDERFLNLFPQPGGMKAGKAAGSERVDLWPA
jgi:hypothetical protein